jgi:hypothetical protein
VAKRKHVRREQQPMTAIYLESTLMQQVEQAASAQTRQPEELIETAVRTYLRQLDRERIKLEANAYMSMHAELVKKYLGQYVAIYNQALVDSDSHFQTLHRRVRQRFGRQPVLIRCVEAQPEHILTFRSPKMEI